ncbi:myb-like protein I [Oppia nitens]|uniref:myb-like protein I n=1 Tax=Oppia nitens TaxID=1686743 RepID=UPI0023D9B927|nr:myb-like protein I [Oppia nitens]
MRDPLSYARPSCVWPLYVAKKIPVSRPAAHVSIDNGDNNMDAATAEAVVLSQRAAEIKESESYINAHFKHCPKCDIPCEKIDGCNHMQCKLCMVHFCWLCLMDITDKDNNNNNNRKQWPQKRSGDNRRPGPTGTVVTTTTTYSNDRKSIIRGLDTSAVSTAAELLATVRQLVKSWSDPTLTADDTVVWVDRSTRFGRTAQGKSNVLVTARTVEANRQLLAAADKYVNNSGYGGGDDSTGSMKWESYRSYHRPPLLAGDTVDKRTSLPTSNKQASGDSNRVGHKQSTQQQHHNRQQQQHQQQRWTPNHQQSRDDIKSVIRGFDTTGVQKLTAFVRQLVDNWKDPTVNSAMIMSVTSNADKVANTERVTLFVTACGAEASRALIETGQLNGVNWSEFRDPKKKLVQQQRRPLREVREVVINSKRISVIRCLNTRFDSVVTLSVVRNLVSKFEDPTVTTEMVQWVERKTISGTENDSSAAVDFYVMASDINANSLLLAAAAKNINSITDGSSDITWLPHSYRYHYDPFNGQSYTSCITELDIPGVVTDLTGYVRELVNNWNDKQTTGSLIVSVEPYVKHLPVRQFIELIVRAVSPEANRQLVRLGRSNRLKWFIVKHRQQNTTTTTTTTTTDLSIGNNNNNNNNNNIIGNTNTTDNVGKFDIKIDQVSGLIDKLIDNELNNLNLMDQTKHQSTNNNNNNNLQKLAVNTVKLKCKLCLANIPVNGDQQFDAQCRHQFCRACLAQYLDSKITDGGYIISSVRTTSAIRRPPMIWYANC